MFCPMQPGLCQEYHGYLYFQDHAGDYVQEYVSGKSHNATTVIKKLNNLYQQSLNQEFLTTIA